MKTNLLNFDLKGLTEHFAAMGEKPFRAKQVMRWIHQSGASDFDEMTDLAKSLRQKLNEQATVGIPQLMTAKSLPTVRVNGCWMSAPVTAWKRCLSRKRSAVPCVFPRRSVARWNVHFVLPAGRASTVI